MGARVRDPGVRVRARDLVGELVLARGGAEVLRVLDTKAISGTSTESDSKTTFNFAVPGASVAGGVSFRVAIRETTGTATPSTAASTARFPQNGDVTSLGASLGGETLKVVFVPVKYMADGSGRTPDTSAATIEKYRAAMHAMYPAAKVEMTARAPYEWSHARHLAERRVLGHPAGHGHAAADRRRRGRRLLLRCVQPSANFNSYCSGSCVTRSLPDSSKRTTIPRDARASAWDSPTRRRPWSTKWATRTVARTRPAA
ncbi:MAG: hypothetical protein U0169_12605 [Polyangiaceae bacterium]